MFNDGSNVVQFRLRATLRMFFFRSILFRPSAKGCSAERSGAFVWAARNGTGIKQSQSVSEDTFTCERAQGTGYRPQGSAKRQQRSAAERRRSAAGQRSAAGLQEKRQKIRARQPKTGRGGRARGRFPDGGGRRVGGIEPKTPIHLNPIVGYAVATDHRTSLAPSEGHVGVGIYRA